MPGAAIATLAYVALALVFTWPLPLGLAEDVPGDLGDALLNMWILGWGAEHVPRILTGQASLADYWQANIFHPEPLTLSLSEHLFGQVLQILPVYHLSGNLILAYNLLFLSSFVLSGLGMFLLVRDVLAEGAHERARERGESMTGGPPPSIAWAAFVAGLIYAFVPFRLTEIAHIQSLSSQWMPMALYGFRRFVRHGRWLALAGGSAALVMQNWSCGYYLVFFAPFVPLFVCHQLWRSGRSNDRRMWLSFAAAGAVVFAATWPLLSLYLHGARVHALERPLEEVLRFSADVYSYATAPPVLNVWGDVMRAYPTPGGELFFGVVVWLLATAGVVGVVRRTRRAQTPAATPPAWKRLAGVIVFTVALVQFAALLAVVATGGFVTTVAGISVRATNGPRLLAGTVASIVLLVTIWPTARARARALLRSTVMWCAVLAVLAFWLSLGPRPQSHGRTLQGMGAYALLYEHVPGFDGLRVPARYAMVGLVFLSVVAGGGAAVLLRRAPRAAPVAVIIGLAAFVESLALPLPHNLVWADGGTTPPARIEPPSTAPAVYRQLAAMPGNVVVAEFPFGDPAWELRYVYYSTIHWKRLLNGYSGAFPRGYAVRAALLRDVARRPDDAWRALREAGTTHVIVHRSAMPPYEADRIVRWLEDHFAVEIARFGDDVLFDLDFGARLRESLTPSVHEGSGAPPSGPASSARR